MQVKPIKLSEKERDQLQIIVKKGSDWREREGAMGWTAYQTCLEVAHQVSFQTPIAVSLKQGDPTAASPCLPQF